MHHYHNPLYVSYGTVDETDGLKQALSLARNNETSLKVLVVSPKFPDDYPDYKSQYEDALLAKTKDAISTVKSALNLEEEAVTTDVELLSDKTPAIKIIQYILQHGHDLLIKEAELHDGTSGFKAMDMNLLRKCPCPVWLCRPIPQSRQDIQVAVAIDPESQDPVAQQLSKRMLALSDSLAESCSGKLHVVSCWDDAFENYLRDNVWLKTPDTAIAEALAETQQQHFNALKDLVKSSGVGDNYQVHHLRGTPEELIPSFTRDNHIDILVMGTVARTGIPGFFIGNTAENIVQRLSCSLLALKPQGFVSPVKAY